MPIYMKYEGIEGPVTGKYKGWISLESCQIGTHRQSPSGHGNNREPKGPSVSEIIVTKFQDSTSTQLFKESLDGKGKKVAIDFVKDDTPYMCIELENTLISSYNLSGSGGDRPMESISLNFTKILYSTKPMATSEEPNRAEWGLATSP